MKYCFKVLGLTLYYSIALLNALPKLSDYAFNHYSQFGEDGIIQKIFETIKPQSKICIEFGAWDGFYLSNTAKLWAHEGWKGILIEADTQKYQDLIRNVQSYNCIPICAFVGNQPSNTLETILKNHTINDSIDLLSIDIDGDDYYIFQSLTTLHPRVIICEFNPTIPIEYDIYPTENNYFGCSAQALIRIAEEKGYKIIAMTDVNCFFVRKEEFDHFAEFETSIEHIKCTRHCMNIITSYAGQYCIVGKNQAPFGITTPYEKEIYSPFIHRITLQH